MGGARIWSPVPDGEPAWDSIVTLEAPSGVRDPLWLNDSTIVGVTLSPVGDRLAFFGRRGRSIRVSGDYPPGVSLPVAIRSQVYQGPLLLAHDGSRLVVATRFRGSLDVYGKEGRLLKHGEGPFDFQPIFHVVPGNKTRGSGPTTAATIDQRLGYLDLAEYHGNILALFSGRRLGNYPKNANFANHVHVFDWDLKFLCALTLDRDILSIATDEESSVLYGVQNDPIPAVVRFDLTKGVCSSAIEGVESVARD